jgi:hypothetical protein
MRGKPSSREVSNGGLPMPRSIAGFLCDCQPMRGPAGTAAGCLTYQWALGTFCLGVIPQPAIDQIP